MKQVNKLITGMAGEYLVAGQMSLRGWTANLTYKNYPGVDIIGQHDRLGDNRIALIQVKASESDGFWVGIKHSQREQMATLIKGPYVLVHFEKKEGKKVDSEYYILTKQQMIDVINRSDETWQAKKHRKPLAPDYPIKIYIRDELNDYKDKWENLFEID